MLGEFIIMNVVNDFTSKARTKASEPNVKKVPEIISNPQVTS